MWLKKITENATSTGDVEIDFFHIKVYPNPAYNTLRIDIPESINTHNLSISIFDSLGRLVEKKSIRNNFNELDVGQFPRGIYQYTIQHSTYPLVGGKFMLR